MESSLSRLHKVFPSSVSLEQAEQAALLERISSLYGHGDALVIDMLGLLVWGKHWRNAEEKADLVATGYDLLELRALLAEDGYRAFVQRVDGLVPYPPKSAQRPTKRKGEHASAYPTERARNAVYMADMLPRASEERTDLLERLADKQRKVEKEEDLVHGSVMTTVTYGYDTMHYLKDAGLEATYMLEDERRQGFIPPDLFVEYLEDEQLTSVKLPIDPRHGLFLSDVFLRQKEVLAEMKSAATVHPSEERMQEGIRRFPRKLFWQLYAKEAHVRRMVQETLAGWPLVLRPEHAHLRTTLVPQDIAALLSRVSRQEFLTLAIEEPTLAWLWTHKALGLSLADFPPVRADLRFKRRKRLSLAGVSEVFACPGAADRMEALIASKGLFAAIEQTVSELHEEGLLARNKATNSTLSPLQGLLRPEHFAPRRESNTLRYPARQAASSLQLPPDQPSDLQRLSHLLYTARLTGHWPEETLDALLALEEETAPYLEMHLLIHELLRKVETGEVPTFPQTILSFGGMHTFAKALYRVAERPDRPLGHASLSVTSVDDRPDALRRSLAHITDPALASFVTRSPQGDLGQVPDGHMDLVHIHDASILRAASPEEVREFLSHMHRVLRYNGLMAFQLSRPLDTMVKALLISNGYEVLEEDLGWELTEEGATALRDKLGEGSGASLTRLQQILSGTSTRTFLARKTSAPTPGTWAQDLEAVTRLMVSWEPATATATRTTKIARTPQTYSPEKQRAFVLMLMQEAKQLHTWQAITEFWISSTWDMGELVELLWANTARLWKHPTILQHFLEVTLSCHLEVHHLPLELLLHPDSTLTSITEEHIIENRAWYIDHEERFAHLESVVQEAILALLFPEMLEITVPEVPIEADVVETAPTEVEPMPLPVSEPLDIPMVPAVPIKAPPAPRLLPQMDALDSVLDWLDHLPDDDDAHFEALSIYLQEIFAAPQPFAALRVLKTVCRIRKDLGGTLLDMFTSLLHEGDSARDLFLLLYLWEPKVDKIDAMLHAYCPQPDQQHGASYDFGHQQPVTTLFQNHIARHIQFEDILPLLQEITTSLPQKEYKMLLAYLQPLVSSTEVVWQIPHEIGDAPENFAELSPTVVAVWLEMMVAHRSEALSNAIRSLYLRRTEYPEVHQTLITQAYVLVLVSERDMEMRSIIRASTDEKDQAVARYNAWMILHREQVPEHAEIFAVHIWHIPQLLRGYEKKFQHYPHKLNLSNFVGIGSEIAKQDPRSGNDPLSLLSIVMRTELGSNAILFEQHRSIPPVPDAYHDLCAPEDLAASILHFQSSCKDAQRLLSMLDTRSQPLWEQLLEESITAFEKVQKRQVQGAEEIIAKVDISFVSSLIGHIFEVIQSCLDALVAAAKSRDELTIPVMLYFVHTLLHHQAFLALTAFCNTSHSPNQAAVTALSKTLGELTRYVVSALLDVEPTMHGEAKKLVHLLRIHNFPQAVHTILTSKPELYLASPEFGYPAYPASPLEKKLHQTPKVQEQEQFWENLVENFRVHKDPVWREAILEDVAFGDWTFPNGKTLTHLFELVDIYLQDTIWPLTKDQPLLRKKTADQYIQVMYGQLLSRFHPGVPKGHEQYGPRLKRAGERVQEFLRQRGYTLPELTFDEVPFLPMPPTPQSISMGRRFLTYLNPPSPLPAAQELFKEVTAAAYFALPTTDFLSRVPQEKISPTLHMVFLDKETYGAPVYDRTKQWVMELDTVRHMHLLQTRLKKKTHIDAFRELALLPWDAAESYQIPALRYLAGHEELLQWYAEEAVKVHTIIPVDKRLFQEKCDGLFAAIAAVRGRSS